MSLLEQSPPNMQERFSSIRLACDNNFPPCEQGVEFAHRISSILPLAHSSGNCYHMPSELNSVNPGRQTFHEKYNCH